MRAWLFRDVRLMREVVLTKAPVELFKILKFEGLAGSGGEAKTLIADGHVSVNGQVETRKRKQIVPGDIIEFGGEQLRVILEG
jgi:ribosome-associated protein